MGQNTALYRAGLNEGGIKSMRQFFNRTDPHFRRWPNVMSFTRTNGNPMDNTTSPGEWFATLLDGKMPALKSEIATSAITTSVLHFAFRIPILYSGTRDPVLTFLAAAVTSGATIAQKDLQLEVFEFDPGTALFGANVVKGTGIKDLPQDSFEGQAYTLDRSLFSSIGTSDKALCFAGKLTATMNETGGGTLAACIVEHTLFTPLR